MSQKRPGPSELKIGVREKTMRKFKRIAKRRGMKYVDAADAAVNALIEKVKAEEAVLASSVSQGGLTPALSGG